MSSVGFGIRRTAKLSDYTGVRHVYQSMASTSSIECLLPHIIGMHSIAVDLQSIRRHHHFVLRYACVRNTKCDRDDDNVMIDFCKHILYNFVAANARHTVIRWTYVCLNKIVDNNRELGARKGAHFSCCTSIVTNHCKYHEPRRTGREQNGTHGRNRDFVTFHITIIHIWTAYWRRWRLIAGA